MPIYKQIESDRHGFSTRIKATCDCAAPDCATIDFTIFTENALSGDTKYESYLFATYSGPDHVSWWWRLKNAIKALFGIPNFTYDEAVIMKEDLKVLINELQDIYNKMS